MKTISALIFPGFEILDMFGPLEMFGMLPEEFTISMVGQYAGDVASAQGPRVAVDETFERTSFDLILIPGGSGARREIGNPALLHWIYTSSQTAAVTMSVCTGSVLIAAADALAGKRATTNKRAFDWVCTQSTDVDWIRKARWVRNGKTYTSLGVSAGIDMSLAVISAMFGRDTTERVSSWAEYEWNDDPKRDPFAPPP